MIREYNLDWGVTDQQVARYEREMWNRLETEIERNQQEPNEISLEGDLKEFYEDQIYSAEDRASEELAFGVAFGRYLFESLDEWRELDEDFIYPIFTEIEAPLWETALEETGIQDTSGGDMQHFRHGFVNQREISEDLGFYQLEKFDDVGESQNEFYDSIQGSLDREDLTTKELVRKVKDNEIETDIGSAEYRSWVNDTMNELAKAGLVGKYRDGRESKFTGDPEDSFRQGVVRSDLSAVRKDEILDEKEPFKEDELSQIRGTASPIRVIKEFAKRSSWKAHNRE